MEDSNKIKFRLHSITNEKTTHAGALDAGRSVSEENLRFQFQIGTVIRFAENVITVIPRVRYIFGDTPVFESGAEFNYSVLSLGNIIEIDGENRKLNMKVNILPTLLGASFSALRGIVYARAAGTQMEKYPVPMIDIDTLLSKNGISIEK